MKRFAAWIMALLMLGGIAANALAEAPVHLNETPTADWVERPLMRLTVFNTTVNDAMLLECGGESLLIDGGYKKWWKKLMPAIEEMGWTQDGHVHVTYLFNTHPHDDHLEAATALVKNGLTADEFWTSFPLSYRNKYQQQALQMMKDRGIPVHSLTQGEEKALGDAALRVFWWVGGDDPNELSALMHVRLGDATLLLTADAVGIAQHGLVSQVPREWLQADIMKMPHHGYTTCTQDFLDAVSPQFVFITNRLFDSKKIVAQMELRNIQVAAHSLGRIVMETDGTEWYVTQYSGMF